MKKTYQVKTQYTFNGTYYVSAESKEEAEQKITQGCGMTANGGIHSCPPEEEIDWNFNVHPDVKIRAVIVEKK